MGFWSALALLLIAIAPAHGQHWPATLRAALLAAGIPIESVGIYVQEIGASRPLLAWNADTPLNPASTMKLVTTLAALERLGPAYSWRTEVYADGPLRGDVLEGNLVLKGAGDPQLTLERFWLLLKDLRERGVREIGGDLIVDRSLFATEESDPGRFDNEPTRPYNVLPDALLVNYKSVRLRFIPQEDSGTVQIIVMPPLPQITIVNQLALGKGNCDFWPDRPQAAPEQARLVFTGVFPRGCGEKENSFSLLSPNQYLHALFVHLWRELGGTFSGNVREATVPASALLLASWQSPPVSEVIRAINKYSNNVMARHVFLTLGLIADAPPATTAKATSAVRAWLRAGDIDATGLVLENGSGLSRNERISARTLARILQRGWENPLMPEYLASLPIPGVDGTLKRRLGDSHAAGQGHVKSGYLDGVRAIAGYLHDRRGRWLIVVAMLNHPNAVTAQPFMDALLNWVWADAHP